VKRVVAVVQARMGSARFPNKMLASLGGIPLLEWVLRRVTRTRCLDDVVLATSNNLRDDALVQVARKCGVGTFRGDEVDVLQRFVGAARAAEADVVVRVCGDNPFIDPGEIDRLIEFFLEHPCDYAFNHQNRLGSNYADGFGAEILGTALLEQIARTAQAPEQREHVTQYLWDHPDAYQIEGVPAPPNLAYPRLRFDVDSAQDLACLGGLVVTGVDVSTPAHRIVELSLQAKA
jgi:spore coat polysaccharide biosynthesis protein SpsF